jgi:hypothetical protein
VRLQGLEPTDRVAAVTRLVSDEDGEDEEEASNEPAGPAAEP